MTRRRASWLAMGVFLGIGLIVAASGSPGPATQAERVEALTRTIKCPQCPGQSVAESDVAVAREMRVDIAERVEAGESDDEIRDYYLSRYGQEVLLNPPRSGLAGLVWVLPVAAFIVAIVALVVTFRRWAARGALEASDADRALVADALAHGGGEHVGDSHIGGATSGGRTREVPEEGDGA